MMDNAYKIPPRVAGVLLNALKGGVVPREGLGHITVGRKDEIDALLRDVETVAAGGAAFRFVVGTYGAGKSFLLQTIRNYAMERGFAAVDADLSPERRLMGGRGEGLATYRELMKNLSVRAAPSGGALGLILQKWVAALKTAVMEEETAGAGDPRLDTLVEIRIHKTIHELETIVHGFDFARVIALYWKSARDGDDGLKSRTLKWLRGEYATKTEARAELGISSIINDDDWYEYIKLFSLFAAKAGYKGMLMIVDETANLFKIPHAASRQNNYEKILTIYNDVMQGKARHLGVVMGGTPQSVEDTRRGLFSYEALRSRLESSRFADGVTRDLLSPVIRLKTLTPEEMYVLAQKLETIHALVYGYEPRLSPDELRFFITTEYGRVGAGLRITPREIIRDFIEILNIIFQNPGKTLSGILSGARFEYAVSDEAGENVREEFKGFDI